MNTRIKSGSSARYILSTPPAKNSEWKFINPQYLEKVSPGNHSFFKEMLKIFKAESLSFLNKIHRQLLENDLDGLAKTAHAMKPTGSYIGVDSLTILVSSLESEARRGDDSGVKIMLSKITPLVNGVNHEIDQYLSAA